MISQNPYSEILELIDTKYQADEFVNQINSLIDELYNKNVDVAAKIKLLLPSPKSDNIISIIQKNNINIADLVRIQTLFQDIKDTILNIPIVNITIPFEPKDQDIKQLNTWFIVNCKQKMFPKISVDKRLLAGAAIGFKGIYKEFTIEKTLQEMYEKGYLNKYIAATVT